MGGRTAAVGWASAAAVRERACDGSEKLRPKNKAAKTNGGHSGRKLPETPTTAFSRLEGLRGECESEVLHCICYYAQT